MFEILKMEISIGDTVKIFLTSGQEPIGIVIEIGENYIVIQKDDLSNIRIFEKIIGGWERIASIKSNEKEVKVNLNEDTKVDLSSTSTKQEEVNRKIIEFDENKNIEDLKALGINVVGKIDLDKIQHKKTKFHAQEKFYRISKISRELDISIKNVFEKLSLLGEPISPNPNTKISEELFLKLKELILKEKKVDKSSNKDVLGIKMNSLEQLKQLKERINVNIEEQLIPANATIKRYGHKGFGYITDDAETDYYFSFSDVLDNDLLNLLGDINQAEGTQVACKLNSHRGRLVATEIILPQKIKNLLSGIEVFIETKDFEKAIQYLSLILNQFPDFDPAIKLRKKVFYEKTKVEKEFDRLKNAYNLAKIELKKQNFEEAKQLLGKAISLNDSKSESALKELAYLLQREGDIDAALDIVKNNSDKIRTSDPNSFIAYFYETKKDYTSAMIFLNKVKPKTKNESIKLEKRKAIAYWGIKDYLNAEKSVLFVLKEQPNEEAFKKFYEGIKSVQAGVSTEELEAIFNEAQLFSLSGGFSPYIQFSLDNCEYKGLPKEILAEENYDLNALKSIRNYIEKAAGNRPIEKAGFLLTEAKLMELLTPEKEIELNEVLAKRSMALAEASALMGKAPDILRFFLLEAFKLAPDLFFVRPHLPIYFASFHCSSIESLKLHNTGWKDSLRIAIDKNIGDDFWNGIVEILAANSKISNTILTHLFQNIAYREKCYSYLGENQTLNDERIQKDRFIKIWNDKINSIKSLKTNWFIALESIANSKTSESLIENFNKTAFPIPGWICQVDSNRINSMNDIVKSLSEFISQNAYEDKERYYNIVINQITQLKSEIEESPTELTFNVIRKLLTKIESLILADYNQLILTSRPDISISLLGECILHELDYSVNMQLSVSNKKGSAPVSSLELVIQDSENIRFIPVENVLEQTLKGGDEKILRLQVIVTEKIKEEGAANILIICKYKVRGIEEMNNFSDNLTLRLYSDKEFVKIYNPFAATADSGPVTDPNMFFGRDIFIENIRNSILESTSKCIIIYGQKRSGKSSVLYHLKEKLINDNDAFCVSFSLGEIVENLSSLTFYYKVLSEMEDALEDMKEIGINVPEFSAPSLTELKEAPSLVFNEYLKKFNKDICHFENWANKKLILLLDEFTYIYTAIQKKVLSDDFMKTWKSFLEKGFFTSVLVGQDIMPKFTESYPNEFGVTEPKRLSYLDKDDAISLIENPIWDKEKQRSRFLGNSVNFILDYTSSNPYYIQIFCARLVDYMNNKKYVSVTEADIIDVAQTFIKGEQSLSADKFDNLITAGDADLEAFSPADVLKALKEIAIASKNLDSCHRDAINLGDKVYEEKILKDLKTREVLSCPTPNFYKINVRLFKEWLLIN